MIGGRPFLIVEAATALRSDRLTRRMRIRRHRALLTIAS
jgi:hypothetical protein